MKIERKIKWLSVAVLVLALAGCKDDGPGTGGGPTAPDVLDGGADEDGPDMGDIEDGGPGPEVGDAGELEDLVEAGEDVRDDAGDGGGGDTGDAGQDSGDLPVDAAEVPDGGDGGDAPVHPESIPSRQTVTFNVINRTGQDRFIATRGWFCSSFGIERWLDGAYVELPLALGFQCGCECPNPGGPAVEELARLESGQAHAFTWDARRLVTYTEPLDCSEQGWPGMGVIDMLAGVRQPVEPGDLRVTVGIEHEVPERCMPMGDERTYQCPPEHGHGELPLDIQRICTTTRPVSVLFTLPPEGDLEVEIALGDGEPADCLEEGKCRLDHSCALDGQGAFCVDGHCSPEVDCDVAPCECNMDRDCMQEDYCMDGACVPNGCEQDCECGRYTWCSEGACRPCWPQCVVDEECPEDHFCEYFGHGDSCTQCTLR